MSSGGYKIRDENAAHFLTFAVVEWVDVFTRSCYGYIVVESLNYCVDNKGLRLHAWVMIPNHVHLMASSAEGSKLSGFLRDFKKHTSTTIVEAVGSNLRESRKNWMLWIFKKAGEKNSRSQGYQFWQQDNHPVELRTDEMTVQRLDYIHNNLVRSGIVRQPDHYVYSSAIDYAGGKGLLNWK